MYLGVIHLAPKIGPNVASKRNPYNEVECGDHYARALAGWGVFTALCGFDYNGPACRMAFAPSLTPEDFKAAFTAAEGWGTFIQQRKGSVQTERITLNWGRLSLKVLSFDIPQGIAVKRVTAKVGASVPVKVEHTCENNTVTVVLEKNLSLNSGDMVEVVIE